MRMLDLSDVPVLVYNMYVCYCTTCMYSQCYCTAQNVGQLSGCILQDWCRRSAALAEIASIVLVAELRQLSEQHVLTLMIQTWHLSLFGHITQIDDNVDEKMLTTSPVEEWKRPPGVTSCGYMYEDSPRWRQVPQSHIDWSSQHGSEPASLWAADYELTWLRTSQSVGCWLWVNMAQNQPVCGLLAMSEHGSEPASL